MESDSKREQALGRAAPRFSVGDRVRVVVGTADPDYPDIPLGGWAGRVAEIEVAETGFLYLVEWNDGTLTAAPPVYRHRCDRDDLEFESTWLSEDVLEPDPGGPVTVEQPTKLVPRPLNLEDPVDLARHILGVSSDDELPEVTPELLRRFHGHLREKVRFPFTAGLNLGGAIIGPGLQPVMVMRLVPLKKAKALDGALRVEVMHANKEHINVPLDLLEPIPGDAAASHLAAFRAWVGEDWPGEPNTPLIQPLLKLAFLVILLAGLLGAVLEALPGTQLPAAIAACALGVLGGLLGARYELMFRVVNRISPNFVGGLLLGFVLGAAVGGGLGTLLAAYVGSIAGAMAGTVLAQVLAALNLRHPGTTIMTLLGACVGAGVAAYLTDADLFFTGLWHGLVAGVVGVAIVALGVLAYLKVAFRERR